MSSLVQEGGGGSVAAKLVVAALSFSFTDLETDVKYQCPGSCARSIPRSASGFDARN